MKLFVFVAVFAFIAVQLSRSAPAPDDDKKDEATTGVPHEADAATRDVKSESTPSEVVTKVEDPTPSTEKKKDA